MTAPEVVEPEPPQDPLTDTTADESEDQEPELNWQDVKQQLRLDTSGRLQYMMKLFESQYEISSPVDAFSHIKEFLGVYMVSSFDVAAFRESLGRSPVAAGKCLDEAYLKAVASDLAAGPELMLRLAMTVARVYGLRMEDWADINDACSEALRVVPACHHLRTQLPAALDVARKMRFLVDESATKPSAPEMALVDVEDAGKEAPALEAASEQQQQQTPESSDVKPGDAEDKTNPWKSLEGQLHFNQVHNLQWTQVELLTAHDDHVVQCFAGAFKVDNVAEVEDTGIVLVTLEAMRIGAPPVGFPEKDISEGDTIFWEAEKGLVPVLVEGIVIEGDWYETKNDMCFLGAVNTVAPGWILA